MALLALIAAPLAPVSAQHVLNLRNADVRAFIQDASRVTGRTFVIDPAVSGTVTVVTDRPLSRSEYFEVFLSTLRANGLVAVPTAGGALRIQPTANAAAQPTAVGSARASNNAFVTEIFRLRNIPSTSAVETLRPLVSQEGSITANTAGNSLVIADFADNVRRMREVISRVDIDNSNSEVISLSNAGAREIAASLQALVTGGEGPAPAAVVPVDSSNSLLLRGDPATVSRLAALARELDARAASGTEIRVIFLEFADAAQILPVLERVTGQASSVSGATSSGAPAPAAAAAPASGGGDAASIGGRPGQQVIVTGYEGANAIIISAPPEMQRTLGELVRQLDTRRDQVLVEAIIVEISDQAARELGVQFLFGGEDAPFAVTNYSNVSPRILDLAGGVLADELDQTTTVINGNVVTTTNNSGVGDLLRENAARSILGARGGFLGFASEIGSDLIFGAILNAVQEDTDSNVLSTPSITTLDNQEAHILVGQEIPISTGEALSSNFDNAFRTIQRENVGIELEVRPQINAGGAIRLDIRQEVSSIAGPVSDDFNELIINKREIQTTVSVNDGEIIALGGLLDDNERRTIQRIPILGDIPIIGELFRSRGRSRVKTNLVVFIRPTILSTAEDRREVMERRYGYVRAQQYLANPDREPPIDTLVRQYLGMTPPGRPPVVPPPIDPQIILPEVSTSSTTVRTVPVPQPEEE
ncbi:type II secretion system secretin GspD [Parasphingopyxis marina]|nr:type II secretion system secretin GspD [Parasphingopyxis marina]